MACDRCDECAREGARFCRFCGRPLDSCPYCDGYREQGYEFCGKCGRSLAEKKPEEDNGVRHMLAMTAIVTMPFLLIMLVLELGSMLWGIPMVFDFLEGESVKIFVLSPGITVIGSLSGLALDAYWVLIFVSITASAAFVVYQSLPKFKPRPDRDTSEAESTPLYWICLLFGSTIIVELIIVGVEALAGTPLETPEWMEDLTLDEMLFSMAEAAFWEEIVARMIPIGLPIALLAMCYGKKDFPRLMLGGFGFSRLALLLLVLSSVAFALAHVPSWGFAKALPTVFAGLALGYLYIRFGIHAAIVFHFLTDYMAVLTNTVGPVLQAALLLVILVIGVGCLAAVLFKLRNLKKDVASLPVTGFESGDAGKGLGGGPERLRLDHHVRPEGLEPREVFFEVYAPVAYGEMGVAVPVVVMDVDVGDPVPKEFEHLLDLTGGVRMAYVEAHGQVCAVHDRAQLLRGAAEHHRERRHVLYTDRDPVLLRCAVHLFHGRLRDLVRPVPHIGYREGGDPRMDGDMADPKL